MRHETETPDRAARPAYRSNCGPAAGPALDCDPKWAIGAYEAGDPAPVGFACGAGHVKSCAGKPAAALFRLVVDGAELPGRFLLVGRQFVPSGDC